MKGKERAWSDDERAEVKGMLRAGSSMRSIGREMGLTRNMVIGRVSRDGELHKMSTVSFLGATEQHELLPVPSTMPEAVNALRGRLPGKALYELGGRACRFPVEEADVIGGHLFCAEARAGESPYCDRHHQLTHAGIHYVREARA